MCPGRHRASVLALAFAVVSSLAPTVAAESPPAAVAGSGDTRAGDLTELSLEDLMNVEVTSTARREQRVADAAAAVFVITSEDLARGGFTSIPEALRLAPGLHVARTGARSWAITSRGFNAAFAHWLLVLIDGRSVYSPLFAGVYWEVQDLPIEDIERIEVIRGPGAALWGANAVNGVINIITKKARDTRGGLLSAGYGTFEHVSDTLRYGGPLGESGDYRVYGRFTNQGSTRDETGEDSGNEWDSLRFGFRSDWSLPGAGSLTVSGDTYGNDTRSAGSMPSLTPPFTTEFDHGAEASGTHVLARWTSDEVSGSPTAVQVYHDRGIRKRETTSEDRVTWDLDLQHRRHVGARHELIFGTGYRVTSDELRSDFQQTYDPESRRDDLFNAFLQDDITFAEGRFRLTLGARIERNDYTGWEVQPDLGAIGKVGNHQAVWGAVSRAVRSPARAEFGTRVNVAAFPGPGGVPVLVSFFGNPEFESETVLAGQAGYRFYPSDRFTLDATAFINHYDRLLAIETQDPFFETDPPPPHIVIPAQATNSMDGKSYGVEIAASFVPVQWWRISGSWTWFGLDLNPDHPNLAPTATDAEEESPKHQAQLHSTVALPGNLAFDTGLYFVDELAGDEISSYLRVDARLSWKPVDGLELSAGGQNLQDAGHREFGNSTFLEPGTEIARQVYLRAVWRF